MTRQKYEPAKCIKIQTQQMHSQQARVYKHSPTWPLNPGRSQLHRGQSHYSRRTAKPVPAAAPQPVLHCSNGPDAALPMQDAPNQHTVTVHSQPAAHSAMQQTHTAQAKYYITHVPGHLVQGGPSCIKSTGVPHTALRNQCHAAAYHDFCSWPEGATLLALPGCSFATLLLS
jgi:hypothetical protein